MDFIAAVILLVGFVVNTIHWDSTVLSGIMVGLGLCAVASAINYKKG